MHWSLDCQDNASLQDQFHPGVFTNSKWSCCDHKSKHSTGCQPTTNFSQPSPNTFPPLITSQPPSSSGRLGGGGGGGGGGRAHRGPLPPTPIDELAPSSSNQLQPPSSRESYFQNHRGPRPNAPYSYEHHDPQGGPPVGHRSGRNPSPDPAPPPVPVSRQYIICIICTVITPCTKPVWTPLNVGAFSAYINRAIMMIMRLGPSTLDALSHNHLALWKVPIE